jgi:phosphoribosylaminoimidazole-succinocarboxamide synthase
MGSVKDLTVVTPPSSDKTGAGYFSFSDRYSVFDWGEMPDYVSGKGVALAMMAAHNFVLLEREGISTHFIGMGRADNPEVVGEARLDYRHPSSTMHVHLTRVISISNDYACYDGSQRHYLIPLEVIYRNGFPRGSSVFRRIEKMQRQGKSSDEICHTLGLESIPVPGDVIETPLYSYTTKLEKSDRFLTGDEARRISGLSNAQFERLRNMAERVNNVISAEARGKQFVNYDGKIEAMIRDGEIVLVDVVGTFDENRFAYRGVQISKEILRHAYRKLQPEFVEAAEEAKEKARAEGTDEWKQFCRVEPVRLPGELIDLVSEVYRTGANVYTNHELFPGLRTLDDMVPLLETWNERLSLE